MLLTPKYGFWIDFSIDFRKLIATIASFDDAFPVFALVLNLLFFLAQPLEFKEKLSEKNR
jgi:hypothetical protein